MGIERIGNREASTAGESLRPAEKEPRFGPGAVQRFGGAA